MVVKVVALMLLLLTVTFMLLEKEVEEENDEDDDDDDGGEVLLLEWRSRSRTIAFHPRLDFSPFVTASVISCSPWHVSFHS